MKITRFFWVRHAPVKAMMPGRIYGQRDVGCSLKDTDRLQYLADELPTDALWVTSTLSRTKKTAKAIATQRDERPALHAYKELMEQNFGLWQSKTWDELNEEPETQVFWNDPAGTCPPDGESFVTLCQRVAKTIDHLQNKHEGKDIICVTHAGTIRAAIAKALNITPSDALRLKVDTLSLTHIDYIKDPKGGDNWMVHNING